MSIETVLQYIARIVFIGAMLAFLLAFIELVGQFINFSLINSYYSPGRLVELAAGLLAMVIAIRLREIRDALRDGQ